MADQGSARSIFVGRWVRVLPVCRARSRRMDVRPPETLQMAFGRASRIPLSIRRLRAQDVVIPEQDGTAGSGSPLCSPRTRRRRQERWHADHLLWIIDETKAVETPI